MNKNSLKIFAVDSKKELIEKIQIKAMQYGIEKDKIKNSQTVSSDSIVINGKPLSKEEKVQRKKLIERVKTINESGKDGYKQVIEEVAYIWFNRFTALRFMEVNEYLPTKVRALSSETTGNVEPDLIKEASNVNLPVDKQKIYEMKLNNDMEGLFKYLIIVQCNDLNKSMPFMFEKIGHYTELLFPDGLLNENAFIRRLTNIEIIPESDWEDVEIIGWLYQYYNSEEKDRVIQAKKKYTKEEIPFATQLFTPDWIVRYMVQNTLGKYWIESHPENGDLKDKWEFYLENTNSKVDFEQKLAPYINKELKIEDIKCFDPAMGSGHILVYMFDVLYEIYEKCGYMNREIPQLIIENNLYGLDIDDRAYQLACFAVIMKGMKYNNRLLRNIEREAERTGGEGIKLNLASIQETNDFNDEDIAYIVGENSGEGYLKTKEFFELFINAKIFGSLIEIKEFDKNFFLKRLNYIINNPVDRLENQESKNKVEGILPSLIKQADIMKDNYDVLVTNPPYMGINYMNSELNKYIANNYSNVKSDLFSAFIDYSFSKVSRNGHLGFMTPYVWMFLQSYEKLRKSIIESKSISTLVQLEYSGFSEATVPICTFTLRNSYIEIPGEYIKLSDFAGADAQSVKVLEAKANPKVYYRYSCNSNRFNRIPGSPISYWVNEKIPKIFEIGKSLGDVGKPRQGMATTNNSIFLRKWYEVDYNKIGFNLGSEDEAEISGLKWFPFNKGGEYRKWYGNNEYVVNYENRGKTICDYIDNSSTSRVGSNGRVINRKYYFKEGLTWTAISSSKFSLRYFGKGFIFSNAGMAIFEDSVPLTILGAFLNSKVSEHLLSSISSTLNFNQGDIEKIPYIHDEVKSHEIEALFKKNVILSKDDWDSYETSWEYKRHPLLLYKGNGMSLEETFSYWSSISQKKIHEIKDNEKELNKIFIDIYDLKNDINEEVSDRDITIRKANREKDIKSFISYAVGHMFGRYSLDDEGLIYAGGNFNNETYKTFKVNSDNIVPIISDSYFEEDIVSKFVEFVEITFGKNLLIQNLNFIAETLGRRNNETAKETIRRYFLNDFYKEHIKMYQKTPIYWMFTSGKQKAFNCLIYMHRYDKTTLSRIRTDYLHELQDRLDTERKALVDVTEGDYSTKEKSESKKKLNSLDKQIDELKKYDEILHHMADMQIELDLDDGVVVNYEKFKGLLAKI